MSLVTPESKGGPISCSEFSNNYAYLLDLGNSTGELDCSKISQSSLTTCLSTNSVITTINTNINNNATAIGEVAQDLTDAQTALQTNINALTTLVNNQNTTISDLNSQIASLIAAFNALDGTVASFNSRLLSVEGRLTTLEDAIAAGIIVVWSGSIASIPASYFLCNGQNSTPDLRDRFIVGAGSTYAVNAIGGSIGHAHTLGGETGNTVLTVDQMPVHTHSFSIPQHTHDAFLFWADGRSTDGGTTNTFDSGDGNVGFAGENQTGNTGDGARAAVRNSNAAGNPLIKGTALGGTTSSNGSNGGHTHSFSTTTANTNNLPPYYALAYIMKV
jgi:cell division protein FtsL